MCPSFHQLAMSQEDIYAPLPTPDVLKNIQITSILNSNISNAVKKYSVVTFSVPDKQILAGWSLNSLKHLSESESHETSGSILEKVQLEQAEQVVRSVLKVLNYNEKLLKVFDEMNVKEAQADEAVLMVRSNFGVGKELMILPMEEFVMAILVYKEK